MSSMIVLVGKLANFPLEGGHWSVFLQYMLGLKSLGHNFIYLELFHSVGQERVDRGLIRVFFKRFRRYGLESNCVVALYRNKYPELSFENLDIINMDKKRLLKIIEGSKYIWNFCCYVRKSLLSLFPRKVLIDLDPGHLQVSSLHWNMDIEEHNVFLTVGTNINNKDCKVPTLGKKWHPFLPPVYLQFWLENSSPDPLAPFTSITQWTWGEEEEMWLGSRWYSVGKRDAYFRFLSVPSRCNIPIELAVNIDRRDQTGDRKLLRSNGWRIASPHRVARSPDKYKNYILQSCGEFGCAKPIYSELRTGWFSDRSAVYLASGRPVVIEDTSLWPGIPVGTGILTFSTIDEAIERLLECSKNYKKYANAAREIADEYFDSDKILTRLIDLSAA